jgi:low affinity Fe/Cu permease
MNLKLNISTALLIIATACPIILEGQVKDTLSISAKIDSIYSL